MIPIDKLLAKMEYDFVEVGTPAYNVRQMLKQKSEEGWRVVSHTSEGTYGWSFVLARKIAEE